MKCINFNLDVTGIQNRKVTYTIYTLIKINNKPGFIFNEDKIFRT